MARHVPAKFEDKLARVALAVDVARGADRRHFDLSGEVEPGVRLVLSDARGAPIVMTLWTYPTDIAEICGDAAFPATAALMAIDRGQAAALRDGGIIVDLGQFTTSASHPGLYYALFDYASERQLHAVLHRLVPALTSHGVAA